MSTIASANKLRRVAIVGGTRIPFCRSNTAYSQLSNLDMLSDTLQHLTEKFDLAGKKIDELIAGAVTSHSRDWNLAREAILSTELSPNTPGTTMQMACGTSLQAAMLIAGRIASGQIECGIAAGSDTTSDAPLVLKPALAKRLLGLGRSKGALGKLSALKGLNIGDLAPMAPANAEPRTGLSMGEHCELMAKHWHIGREEQDALALGSHAKADKSYKEGFFDDLVQPYQGVLRDNNIRGDSTLEKLATLAPAFDRTARGTLTAAN
ncbi:MAG: acetyl-CoA C-acyltransferase, partial [Pseudohongiellaceae bacterium]|nr:acetyl-CoA C-acyltransferase [Pseudohongiellaceae bacterium]